MTDIETPNFQKNPIINSPYDEPTCHWVLKNGMPTGELRKKRRMAEFVTPVPQPKTKKKKEEQSGFTFGDKDFSVSGQSYDQNAFINEIRKIVTSWRHLPSPSQWGVTAETARLLQYWRDKDNFPDIRPFFCQLEAVETAIFLTEVAPKHEKYKKYLKLLKEANENANPSLYRIAMKLATGAGKTTVMAMLIAWQTINAVHHPNSKYFSKGFLIVVPGLTIRDRLRVLRPNDPNSYYKNRNLIPNDYLRDLEKAQIVITNYHAFKLREKLKLAKGTREALEGRDGKIPTLETEGEMLRRVIGNLMGIKKIVVFNDEAHHCYQEKPSEKSKKLKGDEKKDAEENKEVARLWLNGLKIIQKKIGISTVFDLSATPFFLQGSGYQEGTLFPWVVSDFSLMDAIECGVVKLPRIPISDNMLHKEEIPMWRELWKHIGKDMPKSRKKKGKNISPDDLPSLLCNALHALYNHYKETYIVWQKAGISVPPVFIIVCNNTVTSELVYQYISGWEEDGGVRLHDEFALFNNYDKNHQKLAKPNTILVDSQRLESGEKLDKAFLDASKDEIKRFKREKIEREGGNSSDKIDDTEILREVMNTIGDKGKLGEKIRCVVSVSMLTEGWDTNTVTHVLGIRAFGTQLLCEQVIGRALRRESYDLNEKGHFNPEYADILGIPFDFTSEPVVAKPVAPKEKISVYAVPERQHLEILFPRVAGYRIKTPQQKLEAEFTQKDILTITPEMLKSPTKTENRGIIGEKNVLSVNDPKSVLLKSGIILEIAKRVADNYTTAEQKPVVTRTQMMFMGIRRIVGEWIDRGFLIFKGGTSLENLRYNEDLKQRASQKIQQAIERTQQHSSKSRIVAILSPFAPTGSTSDVHFKTTASKIMWTTDIHKSHINKVICDSSWEKEFCRVAEGNPYVKSYVKNQGLGFDVPYVQGIKKRNYVPDFIVQIKLDQEGKHILNLVVEIKGFRGDDVDYKETTIRDKWIPAVNELKAYGQWDFEQFDDGPNIEQDFNCYIDKQLPLWREKQKEFIKKLKDVA